MHKTNIRNLFFLLLLIILAVYKLFHCRGFYLYTGIILIAVYTAWVILEIKMTKKDHSARDAIVMDKGTFTLYISSRLITIYSSLLITNNLLLNAVWIYTGFFFFILGISLRLWAIHTLDQYYSHWIKIKANHKIIDYGPYRFLRHPSYTGMLVAHAGFVVFFFNGWNLIAFTLLFIPAVVRRILIEERQLMASVTGYKQFCKNRKRLVPFIW